MNNKKGPILVTGGAGFIGSHLVDRLISDGEFVRVLDNLSSGKISNLSNSINHKHHSFFKGDLGNVEFIKECLLDMKAVFHLAADPEVRSGSEFPERSFEQNIKNTFNLLEQIRKSNVDSIFFTSSSTVYGEPNVIPTPESYAPLLPISPYGASKLACEALISSYCYTYGIKGIIFRLANIIGRRSGHGVIFDFINKLKQNDQLLEILGNGKQSKSYLHVSDCIDCFLFCIEKQSQQADIFNVGNEDRIDVISIANIVSKSMHLKNVHFSLDGGIDDGRGWVGDVRKMQLDIINLKNQGWKPKFSTKQAVEISAKEQYGELCDNNENQ